MAKAEDKPPVDAVYLGPCTLEGNKRGILLISPTLLAAHPEAPKEKIFKLASAFSHVRRELVVGAIYRGDGKLDGDRLVNFSMKWAGFASARRSDHPTMVDWELRAEVFKAEDRDASIARKLKADPLLLREVEALGRLLKNSPYTQQAATEAAIIQAIRNKARGLKF